MRSLAIAAAAASTLIIAAPASAQMAAPGEPTSQPVAQVFRFATSSVSTTGAAPQPLIRVDQSGAVSATARLVMTPTTASGRPKRSLRKISVALGQIKVNELVTPTWPGATKLVKGYYSVKLNATSETGAKLNRAIGSAAVARLKVIKGPPVAVAAATAPTGLASQMVALAQGEVGVTEAPKGSNDSARIATYRAATPGGPVGAWCAYFISWLARSAGAPLGERGQGYGRVDDLYAWAVRNGKSMPAVGVPVQPGDFMVWDEHIGIVESVSADGTITTIDGNYQDAVTRRILTPAKRAGVVGFVRL